MSDFRVAKHQRLGVTSLRVRFGRKTLRCVWSFRSPAFSVVASVSAVLGRILVVQNSHSSSRRHAHVSVFRKEEGRTITISSLYPFLFPEFRA